MKTKRNKRGQKGLSVKQERAIDLLLMGKNDREVGEELKMSRSKVNEWRNHDEGFIEEMTKRRFEIRECEKERFTGLRKQAVERLEKLLESENEKISFESAKYVLERLKIEEIGELTLAEKLTITVNRKIAKGELSEDDYEEVQ